jgi:hypothetical protein
MADRAIHCVIADYVIAAVTDWRIAPNASIEAALPQSALPTMIRR